MGKFDRNCIISDICNKKEMTQNNSFFTAEMKLADLIHLDYKLLLLLPRFGLNLGFGDQTVQECCVRVGVSPQLFIMICNIYAFENYSPRKEEIDQTEITQLLSYLQRSHSYYLDERIHMIQDQLKIMSANCNLAHQKILNRFFEEYKNEVINHFEYEEETVFPYIQNIGLGNKVKGYEIEIFEQNHSNIDDKLHDLKNIFIKYWPADSSQKERTAVLFNIFSLEEDLTKHTFIEDKVLIPLVQKLEQHYGK